MKKKFPNKYFTYSCVLHLIQFLDHYLMKKKDKNFLSYFINLPKKKKPLKKNLFDIKKIIFDDCISRNSPT